MKKTILLSLLLLVSSISITAQEQQPAPTEKQSLLTKIENWYADNMNYASITILMAAESSILPVPSELVISPAAFIASSSDEQTNPNHLNIFLVILFGTIGALIGAAVNYFVLGMLLGRQILYRFASSKTGHLLLLSGEKLQKAENYFNAHGKISTFVGRFIPVVRHLISIPAGFAKMNFAAFAFFTFIGAGLWNCCLAALGYLARGQANMIEKYSKEISVAIVVAVCLAVAYYILKFVLKKRKKGK